MYVHDDSIHIFAHYLNQVVPVVCVDTFRLTYSVNASVTSKAKTQLEPANIPSPNRNKKPTQHINQLDTPKITTHSNPSPPANHPHSRHPRPRASKPSTPSPSTKQATQAYPTT